MPDSQTLPLLEQELLNLESDDLALRHQAAHRLGGYADERAIEGLLARLTREPDSAARCYMAAALCRLEAVVPTIEPLIPLLNPLQNTGLTTLLAVQLIGRSGDPRTVQLVTPLVAHDMSDVRYAVVQLLGEVGDPTLVPPIQAALQDRDQDVQQLAAAMLRRIGTPDALAALKAWDEWRGQ